MSHRTFSVSLAPPPGKAIRGPGAEPRRGPAADGGCRASPPPGRGGQSDSRPAVGPAVDVGDIVEVVPGNRAPRGAPVLFPHDDRSEPARLIRPAGSSVEVEVGPAGRRILLPAGAVLGVATALEQGDLLFDLSRGRWRAAGRVAAALPAGMGRLLEVMARLARPRRAVFPPLFLGGGAGR